MHFNDTEKIMDIEHKHFDPPTFNNPEELWCSVCDRDLVISDKPETGKFFSICGHVYDHNTKSVKEDWPCVIFAICHHCLENE